MSWKGRVPIKTLRILFLAIVSAYLTSQVPPYLDSVEGFLEGSTFNPYLFVVGLVTGAIIFLGFTGVMMHVAMTVERGSSDVSEKEHAKQFVL